MLLVKFISRQSYRLNRTYCCHFQLLGGYEKHDGAPKNFLYGKCSNNWYRLAMTRVGLCHALLTAIIERVRTCARHKVLYLSED